jgi:hypothetical protein
MTKSDFPALRMRVERGHLVPAGPFDAERLNSYRNGAIVMCRFTEERERVLIKKWFAIIGLVLKTCETPWKTRDEAHEAIKLALGIVNLSKTVGGEFMAYPKSLTELDDPEMTEALENMTELLSRITGVDVATLKKETAHLGQEDTADEPSSPESSDGEDADSAPASEGEGQAASQPSPSQYAEWLFNVARMLWAATNYRGDMSVLKAQKRAAIASYPKDADCPPEITGKAESVYGYCERVVDGAIGPQDGLALIAGIVGCDQDDLQPRRRGAA